MIAALAFLTATNTILLFCLLGARVLTRQLERENDNLRKRLSVALQGFGK